MTVSSTECWDLPVLPLTQRLPALSDEQKTSSTETILSKSVLNGK